ncbi:hypothetical protein [Brachybacterium avium]|uniref:hypothetical protein n=1 Tax=Brachybacterium avium TaxID=2017485 RepID=UPI0012FE6FC0|nr:hypothetical protein [Brachybacterium avium]
MLFTDFDVAAYGREDHGRILVDATAAAMEDLSEETRADLAFLCRLDSAGLSEARALLATWTANEARITAFVATWAFARHQLGRAMRDLLAATGSPLPPPRRRSAASRVRSVYLETVMPLLAPVWTNAVGAPVVAGHMARLAVQEEALQAAYRAVLPRLHEESARVVQEILRRREHSARFFRLEAEARISRSRTEAVTARRYLGRGWEPLRVVGVADPDEFRALTSIFRSPDSRADLARATSILHDLLPAPRRSLRMSSSRIPGRTSHGL